MCSLKAWLFCCCYLICFVHDAASGFRSASPPTKSLRLSTKSISSKDASGLASRRIRLCSLHSSLKKDVEKNKDQQEDLHRDSHNQNTSSRILSISCQNLAGATAPDGGPIRINFLPSQPFVACTGETGSGKSLLMARALELLSGGSATSAMLGKRINGSDDNQQSTALLEIVLQLEKRHSSYAKSILDSSGVDTSGWNQDQPQILTVRREVERVSTSKTTRLRSLCTVNGSFITLKTLSALMSPLLVVVDASVAATALAKPEARLAILDTGVDLKVKQFFSAAQRLYRRARKDRESIEEELANRILPQSFSKETKEDIELMNHWIDEIGVLRSRITDFVESLATEQDEPTGDLGELLNALQRTEWTENAAEKGPPFVSAVYERLVALRDALRSLDSQILAASNAATILSSLSIMESAATAIEKARNMLYDASGGSMAFDRLDEASETSHDLLNQAEVAIAKCARYIEDDDRGLLATLESMRACCPVSVDVIDEFILDWNAISRKHGIPPSSLPSCHMSMINERDGNVEALSRLPVARAAEKKALEQFENACELLSLDRRRVAGSLRSSINSRLPSLGLASSEIDFKINSSARKITDLSTVSTNWGLDSADIILKHGANPTRQGDSLPEPRGGLLHEVASSGEKARILLAIECSLPGSIRSATSSSTRVLSIGTKTPSVPVSIVYDEIDAHVGGSSAVAVGHMLADQSLRSQIIAITHSPAVASIADAHVVVQKTLTGRQTMIQAQLINENERTKELARMASGDLAVQEAEKFANALIRDGLKRRKQHL